MERCRALTARKSCRRDGGMLYLSTVLPDTSNRSLLSHYRPPNNTVSNNCPYRQKVSGGRGVSRSAVSRSTNLATGTSACGGAAPPSSSIMSAKLLRVKQLQNQLSDTQNQLNELVNENRLLRTLQKRQAVALQRFEGSQDQLPHLIKSHNEEIRVLTSKIKQLKDKCCELERRLKRREGELIQLKDHHKHLVQLSQDKSLGDREALTNRVQQLEATQKLLNDKIQMLTRRLELEGKNYRHQLNQETTRFKETQNDLKSALGTINNLKAALEAKEKYVNSSMPKRYQRSMDHLMQGSHASLPVPPRVSIRQTDKYSDAVENQEDYSSDSEEDSIDKKENNRDPDRVTDDGCAEEKGEDDIEDLMRRGSDESSDGLKRLPAPATLDRHHRSESLRKEGADHRSVRWKPGPPTTHTGSVVKRSTSKEGGVGGLSSTYHQQRNRRENTRRGYAADRESSGEEGARSGGAPAAPSSNSLAPFSKLSWSRMRMALPESTDKVIELLEQANGIGPEERDKTGLGTSSTEECKPDDEERAPVKDRDGGGAERDVEDSATGHSPISSTRKKRILEEIFKA